MNRIKQHRIHIFGASGSGTTTLGKALSEEFGIKHFDTDDFFWIKSEPPYQNIVPLHERQQNLNSSLTNYENWVLSGSLCGWGDFTIPYFTAAVFLYLPNKIRMERLWKREIDRYGMVITDINHPMHQSHQKFIAWANAYDEGGIEIRSKRLHEEWIKTLPIKVITITGETTVTDAVNSVICSINN